MFPVQTTPIQPEAQLTGSGPIPMLEEIEGYADVDGLVVDKHI